MMENDKVYTILVWKKYSDFFLFSVTFKVHVYTSKSCFRNIWLRCLFGWYLHWYKMYIKDYLLTHIVNITNIIKKNCPRHWKICIVPSYYLFHLKIYFFHGDSKRKWLKFCNILIFIGKNIINMAAYQAQTILAYNTKLLDKLVIFFTNWLVL